MTSNGFTFNTFVFFWNEDDIVASGTGINFLNQFTDVASTSSDTFTEAGFPVTIWTDPSGLDGVGVIDSDVSVVMYGPPARTQPMLHVLRLVHPRPGLSRSDHTATRAAPHLTGASTRVAAVAQVLVATVGRTS